MNTHDVSDFPQYAQMLAKQKQNILDAQSRKGQRPSAKQPRALAVFRFMLSQTSRVGIDVDGPGYFRTSFVPSAYLPCVQPVAALTKIMMNQLLLETHHRGRYLLVRCVTPQDRLTAIMAMVEDENDDVLLLQLYHQEDPGELIQDILVNKGVVIVKEPYLKCMSDGNHGLRVDHITDVVFLAADDERVPTGWREVSGATTALAWKTRGNDYFKQSNYRAAVDCYTKALSCSPTEQEEYTIKLNRSQALLNMRSYDGALFDLETATPPVVGTEPPKTSEKALFRKAQALYGLQRFRECCEVFKFLCLEYPANLAAKAELDRAISRLMEQTHGKYSFKKMHTEAGRLRPPHLDHATFVGPVCVKESKVHGRGLFTTKEVAAGDLLLCEKAFAHAFIDEEEGGIKSITTLIDAEANTVTIGTQPELINATIQKLHRNNSLRSVVMDLHRGSYEAAEADFIDGKAVVDSFLVQHIVRLNVFGCPLTSRASYLRAIQRPSRPERSSEFHSCGIWPTASYINHDCHGNSAWSFIGDMMIVRAQRDLPADTELTWPYRRPAAEESYSQRQRVVKHWGFTCGCLLCLDAKGTPKSALTKRQVQRAELSRALGSLNSRTGTNTVAKIDAALGAMVTTYRRPARDVPRLCLGDMQLKVAGAFSGEGQVVRCAGMALAALESFGRVVEGGRLPRASGTPSTVVVRKWGLMCEAVIDCWMFLREAYHVMAPELVAPADAYARTAYRTCLGEDEAFDAMFEKAG